tara:strand:- start:45 stop:893 length:849 start_codon:yes stop_codon:yes gene_type:complete
MDISFMDISFEFFPPSSDRAEIKLWDSIKVLEPLNPNFVSVTYGAGGTTRDRTHNCVKKIIEETNLEPAAHLTCVNSTKDEIKKITDKYKKIGVKHIVAVRGDMPNFANFEPHPKGYKSSIDLVKNLSDQEFNVTVSAYPEKHPDALSFDQDIEFLKRKIDAGATQAITQFCFDFEFILSYRDLLLKHNINIPIIPGIMPTTNFKGIQKMSRQCSTSIPEWLENKYNGLEDSIDERKKISKEIAVDFCQKLISNDFKAIHFYTLNQSELTLSVCQSLNISDE